MRLLPILKPAGWDGVARGAWAHRWLGGSEEPLVYVGYVWENEDELTYVTQQTDQFADTETIVRQAFENLEAYEVTLEVVSTNGAELAVTAGQPFAAERVLCQKHMLDIHEQLGAERIVTSVAKRGAMLTSAWDCTEEAKATLINLHLEAWKSADHYDAVTDHLVVYEGGVKTASLAVAPNGDVDGW